MAAQPQTKTLSLVKGDHHFCFRYEVGSEAKIIDAFSDMVRRKEFGLDWFDETVLSHQLGQHLIEELVTFFPKKKAA